MFTNEKILTVTADTFEQAVLKSTRPVVVDFWGTTCGPCRMIKPRFEALADEFSDAFQFVAINIEANKELVKDLGLRSMPTFRVYFGGEARFEVTGIQTFNDLTAFLAGAKQTYHDLQVAKETSTVEVEAVEVPVLQRNYEGTDVAKFRTLFDEMGITYDMMEGSYNSDNVEKAALVLQLEAKEGEKVKGYHGFVCEYYFDFDGKFIEVGIWE